MTQIDSRAWGPEIERLAGFFRAQRHIPALGDCSKVDVTGPIHVSSDSRLFFCHLPGKAEKFLIKCCYIRDTEQPDLTGARKQYDALVHLNETRGTHAGFNLVQPFHLFADQAIIVQSWIEGTSLDRAFADGRYSVQQLGELLRAAGAWLGHFHRFGSDGQCAPVSRSLVDEIEEGAKSLGKGGRRLTRAMQALRRSTAFEREHSQPVAILHCDFKPANVIASGSDVFAIDFQFAKRASIYFDIAHFLNSAALDAVKARRIGLVLRRNKLHQEFVAGYASVAGPIDPLVLAVYLIYDLGRYMLQYGETKTSRFKGLIKWWTLERLLEQRRSEFLSLQRRRLSRTLPI